MTLGQERSRGFLVLKKKQLSSVLVCLFFFLVIRLRKKIFQDLDLSASKYKELLVIYIAQNFHIGASLMKRVKSTKQKHNLEFVTIDNA